MEDITIHDKMCPVCREIGSGILFFAQHWNRCRVNSEEMSIVEDIEFEEL